MKCRELVALKVCILGNRKANINMIQLKTLKELRSRPHKPKLADTR